ncbi:hypothetical protein Dda_0565 [Drechslerella dactyloides]|uniref:SP-RING-type domain-containing protein n=1 Tax=Drechslerella dactyloides TaxID=74499 RepID=A0AAD6J4T8_DREDA|nr:hypothetical protein Dda_0565 [Drechslerella dactyloides]
MAAIEANQYPHGHDARRGDEAPLAGPNQAIRIDTSLPAGHPGRPPKRKGSLSSANFETATVNSTLSMFSGGPTYTWMHGANANARSPDMPPMKRAKTAPSKTDLVRRRSEARSPSAHSHDQAAVIPEQQQPVVITIPDTQPDDQTEIQQVQIPSPDASAPAYIGSATSNSASYPAATTYTEATATSTTPFTTRTSELVPSRLPPGAAPTTQASGAASIVQTRARPASVDMTMPAQVNASPSVPRPLNLERIPRTVPPIQTSMSGYVQNITPPPSTSPVSATAFTAASEHAMRSAAVPSPVASPQMSEPSAVDVPTYLPDGTIKIYTINVRRASIEDHNLLMADLARLVQQIKDSPVPNSTLLARYSKLSRALEIIRSQINPARIQTPQELFSGILQRTPTAPEFPAIVQSQSTPSRPVAVTAHSIHHPSIPHAERPRMQLRPALPPVVFAPSPQLSHPNPPMQLSGMNPHHIRQALTAQVVDIPSSPSSMWPSGPAPMAASAQHPPPRHPPPRKLPHQQLPPQQLQPQQPLPRQPPPQQPPVHHPPRMAQAGPPLAPMRVLQQPAQQAVDPNNGNPPSPRTAWCTKYIGKLQNSLKELGRGQAENDILRANLLEQAFNQADGLFVALHLIFCSADHPGLKDKYAFIATDPRARVGLELLSQLLLSNSTLSPLARNLFVNLPLELSAALVSIEGFSEEIARAMDFLCNFRAMFDNLHLYCQRNRLPGPSSAMMASIGINSPALQQTISISITQMLRIPITVIPRSIQARQQQGNPQRRAQQQTTPILPSSTEANAPSASAVAGNVAPNNSIVNRPPPEQPDFNIFVTDWGGKVAGWKLILDWKDLPADLQRPEGNDSQFFTYFRRLVSPIVKIKFDFTPQSLQFEVEGPLNKSFPKPNRAEGTPMNVRPVGNRSKLYRLRCVSSRTDLTEHKLNDFAEWRSRETFWLQHCFAELSNGPSQATNQNNPLAQGQAWSKKRHLRFRRKRVWGKDCPTDLTDGVVPGTNTIEFTTVDTPLDDGRSYFLAVEEVEIADYNTLFQQITEDQKVKFQGGGIANWIKPSADTIMDGDDDCMIVEPDTAIISITCPMSQQIIDVPVRGKDCKHVECFDLKGYLESRTKLNCGFSVPDGWKCPICSCECTPPMLTVDPCLNGALHNLKKLRAEGKHLECKSIIFRSDGKWRPNNPVPKKEVEAVAID